jgi:hypothetical protein
MRQQPHGGKEPTNQNVQENFHLNSEVSELQVHRKNSQRSKQRSRQRLERIRGHNMRQQPNDENELTDKMFKRILNSIHIQEQIAQAATTECWQ